MGLEGQPYNYTFSLLPWNGKRPILTFKMLGLSVHLGNQLGSQVHKAWGNFESFPKDYKENYTGEAFSSHPFPPFEGGRGVGGDRRG